MTLLSSLDRFTLSSVLSYLPPVEADRFLDFPITHDSDDTYESIGVDRFASFPGLIERAQETFEIKRSDAILLQTMITALQNNDPLGLLRYVSDIRFGSGSTLVMMIDSLAYSDEEDAVVPWTWYSVSESIFTTITAKTLKALCGGRPVDLEYGMLTTAAMHGRADLLTELYTHACGLKLVYFAESEERDLDPITRKTIADLASWCPVVDYF